MLLSRLKGNYDVENKSAKFYDEVSIIDGELRLKTDSLLFDTNIDRAYFLGPTYITQGENKIYCEDGFYDIKAKRAYFSANAILYNSTQTVKGENIRYDGVDSLFVVSGQAEVQDSLSFAKGDVITKNERNGDVLIEGNGYYQNEGKTITGPYIKFNEKTESILLEGRSTVMNDKGTIEGDTISYDKVLDFGRAIGDVIWKDTVENIRVEADILEYKESSSYYKAVVKNIRPVFMQQVEEDTMFLSADTLINATIGDSINYLQAISSVKIFKSDLQAVCDSLYYSDVDSIFRLFEQPISWSDTTQFLGDTMTIKLTNDNVSDLVALNNAFISSVDFDKYYNQIKGRYIHSYLDSNVLQRMLIKGNAESLYMIKDGDDKYIGPNYTACSHMMFYFDNDELDNVKYYTEPTSVMTPMKKAGDSDLYLKGFKWHGELRPKNRYDIRVPVKRPSVQKNQKTGIDVFEQEVKDAIFNKGKPLKKKMKNKQNKKQK
jgi:lipopolysaccharide export system protein LptA